MQQETCLSFLKVGDCQQVREHLGNRQSTEGAWMVERDPSSYIFRVIKATFFKAGDIVGKTECLECEHKSGNWTIIACTAVI